MAAALHQCFKFLFLDRTVATMKMLELLSIPGNLVNFSGYVVGDPEKMDGTGYSCGLRRDEMPIQAGIISALKSSMYS